MAFVGLLKTGEHSKRCCLAAAAGAEQRQELTSMNIEVEFVDGNHGAEALGYVDKFDAAAVLTHTLVPPSVRCRQCRHHAQPRTNHSIEQPSQFTLLKQHMTFALPRREVQYR